MSWLLISEGTVAPPGGAAITTATGRPSGCSSAVRDALALVRALGFDRAAAVVGHDFGSPVAALVRPHPP